MRFAATTTTHTDPAEAAREIAASLRSELGDGEIDLAVIFFSAHHSAHIESIASGLRESLRPRSFAGCVGQGIIGSDHEHEERPAIAALAARLPRVKIESVCLGPREMLRPAQELASRLPASMRDGSARLLILLGDPFSTPVDGALETLAAVAPRTPVVGGMASGARAPGESILLLDEQVERQGAAALALSGEIEADTVVSQGCRPFGPTLTVTDSRENLIQTLDGQPPLARIEEIVEALPSRDRDLLRNGLFVGRSIRTGGEDLGRGDFLIRGVMGIDRQSGAMAVADSIAAEERIRFHLRDAETAREDLELLLTPQSIFGAPKGGLLFSCNGRGRRLYGEPDGDLRIVRSVLGEFPLCGFFCAGEIGPVGGRNFLHGHTASLVLFR